MIKQMLTKSKSKLNDPEPLRKSRISLSSAQLVNSFVGLHKSATTRILKEIISIFPFQSLRQAVTLS